MSVLFTPLRLRELTVRNRVWMSPMCQYSAVDGLLGDWHLAHLLTRAVGGVGLVMIEATAVTAGGRISPADVGLYNDGQQRALQRVVTAVHEQGVAVGVQLSHAGRKASVQPPWLGGGPVPDGRGWQSYGPSALAFPGLPAPRELTGAQLDAIASSFAAAARRADEAGVDIVELHAAHGYLLHSFLSPLSNERGDRYGGELTARMRFPLQVVEQVRAAWPDHKPLLLRLSATDYLPDAWDVEQSVVFAKELAVRGVDLVDASSGGIGAAASIPVGPGYQVELAATIRAGADVPTAAVGMITGASQAEQIVATGAADAVFLGRALLSDPYWAHRAGGALGASVTWPVQYQRAPRPAAG